MTQTQPDKVFLVVNKRAGYGRGAKAVKIAVPFLREEGYLVDYAFTKHPGHATELAKEASVNGYDMVVAVGGDGTVNEVARGLLGTSTVMGIVPIGSGNGLARSLGISMNMHKSTRALANGKNMRIDTCKFNDNNFFCTSGVGFDGLISDLMDKVSSRGFMQYAKLIVRESLFFRPFNARIVLDGKTIEKQVFLVTFANASQFGNNAFIAPSASLCDEMIDVVVVGEFSKFWVPLFAMALFVKMVPQLPFVESYRAREIDIEMAETNYCHFDGEAARMSVPTKVSIGKEKVWVRCGD